MRVRLRPLTNLYRTESGAAAARGYLGSYVSMSDQGVPSGILVDAWGREGEESKETLSQTACWGEFVAMWPGW